MQSMFRLILITALIISCKPARKMSTQNKAAFDWQGHRGCRGLMPENTIPAMLKALDLGVVTLEMDAVITKDKEVVLSHETFFNHEITTRPGGAFVQETDETKLNIYEMTYDEVKRYDVGLKQHPRFAQQQGMAAVKPRLADVIDSAEAHAIASKRPLPFYNIETKSKPVTDNIYHPLPAEFVELVMRIIKDRKTETRTIIQSFDIRTLQYLHQKYPAVKTALLIESYDRKSFTTQLAELGFTPSIYSPDHSLVTPLLVKQCREKGIKLIPYTVNEVPRMKELKEMGVDGIITDYPNLIF